MSAKRNLFTQQSTENVSVPRTSHKIVQKIIGRRKPLTDGNYIKERKQQKSQKANLFANISILLERKVNEKF